MPGELGFDTGPFVAAATFCERVLDEKDGSLSIIRMVNQLEIHAEGPEVPDDLPEGVITPTLFVAMRAGEARGSHTFQVTIESPDGSHKDSPESSVTFPGGPEGTVNLIIPMKIPVVSAGLYWVDIKLNKRLMTRVPLRVVYGFTRGPAG